VKPDQVAAAEYRRAIEAEMSARHAVDNARNELQRAREELEMRDQALDEARRLLTVARDEYESYLVRTGTKPEGA
jgi:hypothetical protein